jgi:hypothetical protein
VALTLERSACYAGTLPLEPHPRPFCDKISLFTQASLDSDPPIVRLSAIAGMIGTRHHMQLFLLR